MDKDNGDAIDNSTGAIDTSTISFLQMSTEAGPGDASAAGDASSSSLTDCSLDLWRQLRLITLPVLEYMPALYHDYNRYTACTTTAVECDLS
jgi:hypothetical protein